MCSWEGNNKRGFGTCLLPMTAHLLQFLMAICAHRLDTVRHLHWIHRIRQQIRQQGSSGREERCVCGGAGGCVRAFECTCFHV